MIVDGVVGRRRWWGRMVLHGDEKNVAAPNELPPEGSCDDLDLDARTML